MKTDMKLATVAVHGGSRTENADGAAVQPIFQTTTFHIGGGGVRYTRYCNNPNQQEAGRRIAALHAAEAGMVTASGMCAISTALLALLQAGDHLLVQKGLYGGTHSLVTQLLPAWGITHTDINNRKPDEWESALTPSTKVIYVETVSNPLTNIPDLAAVAAFAGKHGLLAVCDNTFASPILCRPITLGFDLVLESASKYINGHTDVVAGAYVGSTEIVQRILKVHLSLGGSLDPHACFLVTRGLQTLPLRMRCQAATALALATFLEQQPQVEQVHLAGLPSHPDYALCQQFLGGCAGAVLAFDLRGGASATLQFIQALSILHHAPSLGGVDTLVSVPAWSSHADMTPEQRQASGIKDSTIRVAVGIEDEEDLVRDLKEALRATNFE